MLFYPLLLSLISTEEEMPGWIPSSDSVSGTMMDKLCRRCLFDNRWIDFMDQKED